MKHSTQEASVVLAYAEQVFDEMSGFANLHGYGLTEGKGGRMVIALSDVEYENNSGDSHDDLTALTRSRLTALSWLCDAPLVSRMRDALAGYEQAEEIAKLTGDNVPVFECADLVIALAQEWVEPPKDLGLDVDPVWSLQSTSDHRTGWETIADGPREEMEAIRERFIAEHGNAPDLLRVIESEEE